MPTDGKRFLKPEVLAQINDLEFRARSVVTGFVSGIHRSPYHGYSVEFAQHREYVPGDDIRHLDWRVYGKTNRFYIKQFEEETNLRCQIVLDCSSSMRYPDHQVESGRMTKFEYAATVAASLAYLLIHQQDAVGLTMFDNDIRTSVPALSNHAHVRSLIEHVDRARLEMPTQSSAMFERIEAELPSKGVVVVVSDLLADVEDVLRGLRRFRHGDRDVIVMHVLDRDEREFPFQDNTMFEGLEAPELTLLADPQSLRTSYLEAVNGFIARIRNVCTNQRIDYVGLSTTDPLDVALRSYLSSRAHMIKARA